MLGSLLRPESTIWIVENIEMEGGQLWNWRGGGDPEGIKIHPVPPHVQLIYERRSLWWLYG
jgi:hypothetical protein